MAAATGGVTGGTSAEGTDDEAGGADDEAGKSSDVGPCTPVDAPSPPPLSLRLPPAHPAGTATAATTAATTATRARREPGPVRMPCRRDPPRLASMLQEWPTRHAPAPTAAAPRRHDGTGTGTGAGPGA